MHFNRVRWLTTNKRKLNPLFRSNKFRIRCHAFKRLLLSCKTYQLNCILAGEKTSQQQYTKKLKTWDAYSGKGFSFSMYKEKIKQANFIDIFALKFNFRPKFSSWFLWINPEKVGVNEQNINPLFKLVHQQHGPGSHLKCTKCSLSCKCFSLLKIFGLKVVIFGVEINVFFCVSCNCFFDLLFWVWELRTL